jgi:hypothetical protein
MDIPGIWMYWRLGNVKTIGSVYSMRSMEPLTVFTFFSAMALIVWGYLIGIRKKLSLIPGHAPIRIRDERGYAIWVGYNLLGMGTLGIIDGLLQAFSPETHVSMFLAYAVIIVPMIGIRIIAGKKRYEDARGA